MKKEVYGTYNKDNKILYIVNQKAANTTIVHALVKHGYTTRKRVLVDTTKLNYVFTFVRNPYDRLVSRYTHLKSYFIERKDKPKGLNIGPSIRETLEKYFNYYNINFCEDNFDFLRFVKYTQKNTDGHWGPQLDKFTNQVVDVNNIDFIGKIENFQEDFDNVCDKIGVPRQQLPHRNKSKNEHKHYTEYYNDETRQIVAKIYAKDIEYFGYKFGG